MKHKNSIITSCLALALAGSAHAAGVWTSINWTDDTSLSFITSTNVTHSADFVAPSQSAATINGFTFEAFNINAGFSFLGTSPYSGSNFTIGDANKATWDASAGVSGTASTALSTALLYSGSATFNLTGLSTNTNYAFYFFSPEMAGTRTGSMDGNDDGVGNSFAIDQSGGTGDKIIKYAYNTGASTTFTMTVDNSSNQLHYYSFANVTAIPEPSTALLGGLGMLALLRRRR